MSNNERASELVYIHTVTLSDKIAIELDTLRKHAWLGERGMAHTLDYSWIDRHDLHASHFLCFSGDILVGAARLTIHASLDDCPDSEIYSHLHRFRLQPPIGVLSRLVVRKEFRQQGIANELDELRMKESYKMKCDHLIGFSSDPRRMRMLEERGFKSVFSVLPPPTGRFSSRGPQTLFVATLAAGKCTAETFTQEEE